MENTYLKAQSGFSLGKVDGNNGVSNSNLCKFCKEKVISDENVLTCGKCDAQIHYRCTNLPNHMIFTLNELEDRYVCEECIVKSEKYLREDGNDKSESKPNSTNSYIYLGKYEELENRINGIVGVLEKLDFEGIVNKMLILTTTIEQTNKQVTEKVSQFYKDMNNMNTLMTKKMNTMNSHLSDQDNIHTKLEMLREEAKSLRATNDKLLISINEKDKKLRESYQHDEQLTQIINEQKQLLRCRELRIKKMDEINEYLLKESVANSKRNLQNQIIQEAEKPAPYSNKNATESTEEQKTILSERIEDFNKKVQMLEGDLTKSVMKQRKLSPQPKTSVLDTFSDFFEDNSKKESKNSRPNVIILHDSLCKDINGTITGKVSANYKTEKVPVSSLIELNKKLDEIKCTDVIVIQALKNSLKQKSSHEINKLINEATSKALTKAKKVVLCTIVARDDDISGGGKQCW